MSALISFMICRVEKKSHKTESTSSLRELRISTVEISPMREHVFLVTTNKIQ